MPSPNRNATHSLQRRSCSRGDMLELALIREANFAGAIASAGGRYGGGNCDSRLPCCCCAPCPAESTGKKHGSLEPNRKSRTCPPRPALDVDTASFSLAQLAERYAQDAPVQPAEESQHDDEDHVLEREQTSASSRRLQAAREAQKRYRVRQKVRVPIVESVEVVTCIPSSVARQMMHSSSTLSESTEAGHSWDRVMLRAASLLNGQSADCKPHLQSLWQRTSSLMHLPCAGTAPQSCRAAAGCTGSGGATAKTEQGKGGSGC